MPWLLPSLARQVSVRQLLRATARFADDWHARCNRSLRSARGRIEGVPQTESGGHHVEKHVVEFGGTVRMVGSRCRIGLGVRPSWRAWGASPSFRSSPFWAPSPFLLRILAVSGLSTASSRCSELRLLTTELPALRLFRRSLWRVRWLWLALRWDGVRRQIRLRVVLLEIVSNGSRHFT